MNERRTVDTLGIVVRALTPIDMASEIVSLHQQLVGAAQAIGEGCEWWGPYVSGAEVPLAEKIAGLVAACEYWHGLAERRGPS